MISALLPGVRELRTPLVTGSLWGASLWLLVGPTIAASATTIDFVGRVGLRNLPVQVWFGASLFAAYLVGSLLVVKASPLGRRGELLLYGSRGFVRRLDDELAPRRWKARMLWRVWRWSGSRFQRRVRAWAERDEPQSQIEYWLRNEFQAYGERGQVPVMRSFLGGCMQPTGLEGLCDAKTISSDGIFSLYRGDENLMRLADAFVEEVKCESREVEVRIQMRHPELYTEIDRLKVEGEFRFSIFWPLLVLNVLLAWQWSPLVLPLLVVPPLLVRDGFERAREASDKVWGALMAREVTSPTLDAIERACGKGEVFDFGARYPAYFQGGDEGLEDAPVP